MSFTKDKVIDALNELNNKTMETKKEKWTIKDLIYLTSDDEKFLDKFLYKIAFEDENAIRRLCQELGWNGGTIHQVRDEIMKLKLNK